jgi:hypothetical protein
VVGGGGGGGGLFSGGRDGKTGGGQGGGQGNFPGYINAGAAPGGGPSGYGGFGGGGGGDAFGAGGGGAGYMGGIGGDAYHGFRAPWGTGGRGGLTLFMGDEQIGICERCGPGDGLATLTYIVPGSGGGYAGSIAPGVPEPASWAMLIAGFGLVGAAQRRSGRGGPQPAAG